LIAVSAGVIGDISLSAVSKGSNRPNKHGPAPGDFDLPYLLFT
jgi:hypothetical protein